MISQEGMKYIIIMAVAFVAAVVIGTILLVTRKKEKKLLEEEELAPVEPLKPVKPARAENTPQGDKREALYRAQKASQDDFGFVETNPIMTASSSAAEKYLSMIRTASGESVLWQREETVFVRNLHGICNASVEVYRLYLRGKPYKKLYFCPNGKNTSKTPRGFVLDQNGQKVPFGGSIALEAAEKGITEEQVLQKQALIYQNKTRQSTGRQGTARQAASDAREVADVPGKAQKKQSIPAVSEETDEAPAEDVEERPSSGAAGSQPEQPAASQASEKPQKAAPSSFPNYLPGFEPDNIKPSLDKFLAVMDSVYPDGTVIGSTWDHEHWDRAAAMLCKYLGYSNGTDFLEAYGYTVVK